MARACEGDGMSNAECGAVCAFAVVHRLMPMRNPAVWRDSHRF